VMDLVAGETLDQLIQRGPVAPRRAAELIREVARALHHAHELGVIHRDLKPNNILLDERGHPRVTDFGLAGQLEERARLTRTGQFIGTLGFAPPEQMAFKRERVDARSDVFALGATLYALLTGQAPGQEDGPYALLTRVLNNEVTPPSALRAGLDPRLDAVCLRCLAAEREDRYPSAAALADDLERFLDDQAVTGSRVGLLQRLRRRRRPLFLALGLLPGLAILAWSASRFGEPPASASGEVATPAPVASEAAAIDWETELGAALDLPGPHAEAVALLSDPAHPELAWRLELTLDELSAALAGVEEELFAQGAPDQLPALRAELRAPFAAPLPAELLAARRRLELELHRRSAGPAVLRAQLEHLQQGLDPSLGARARRVAAWLEQDLVQPPASARPALADALARLVRLEGAPLEALPYARALVRLESDPARIHRCLAWHGIVLARGLADLVRSAPAPEPASDLLASAGRAWLCYLDRDPEALRACLEPHRGLPAGRHLLAFFLLNLQRWKEGLRVLGEPEGLESARGLGIYASLLAHLRRNDEAEQRVRRALDLDPREPWAWRAKGYLLLNLAQRDEAARAFAREAELDPFDPVAHYHRGRALRRDRRYRRSIAAFDAALALDPRYPKPFRNRALAHARLGELDAAIADVDRAVELAPLDPYPLVVRARIRRQRKEPALPDLEAALRLDPTQPAAWSMLAEVHLGAGELEQGLAACKRALASYPKHPDGWATLGEFERRAGRRAEALKAYARSLEFDPDNTAALNGRAQLYLSERDHERALADLERAFRVTRGAPNAAIALAYGRRLAGDLARALELCNDVLEAAPHYDALLERAAVQAELGHEDLALLDLERASELAPRAARPYVQRGALHLRAKRYPAVLEAVAAALRRSPDEPHALALRGLARLKLGIEGARQDLEGCLRLDPAGSWRSSVERALAEAGGD